MVPLVSLQFLDYCYLLTVHSHSDSGAALVLHRSQQTESSGFVNAALLKHTSLHERLHKVRRSSSIGNLPVWLSSCGNLPGTSRFNGVTLHIEQKLYVTHNVVIYDVTYCP